MFCFKQFTVADDMCAMKVGTDGVLLGAWADVAHESRLLDVGTGTGLIALMLAQRNGEARIEAIDIDADAVAQARSNADASPWGGRITTHCGDIREFSAAESFDHIVSNPPYFVDSHLSPNAARTAARHTSSLGFNDLVAAACRLLRKGGRLSVILPTDCAALFRREAFERLWLVRQLDIVTCEGEAPKRTMMEFCKCEVPLMPKCEELVIQMRGGDYSEEYRRLTEDFYLKF